MNFWKWWRHTNVNFRKWWPQCSHHFRKFANYRLALSAHNVPTMFTNFKMMATHCKWPSFSEIRNFLTIGPQNTCIWGQNTPNTRWQQRNSPSRDMYFLDLQKNLLKSPIYGLHGGHYNLHPLIGGHHCQRDNRCNDPINNNKHKCRIQYLYLQAQL